MKRYACAVAVAIAVGLSVIGCNTDATPKTCIELAQESGAPDSVVEYMRRPLDSLNAVERIALRTALDKFGLGAACDATRQALGEG